MDDRTTGESPHELLLALAGRVDDDLLAWCRELVAVGEDARALELLTATLIADRTALPVPERAALVVATRAARTDLDADAALAPAAGEDDTVHRFDAGLPGLEHLAAAVGALPARQVAGLRTWVTLRVTPAGTAPGPLPHPVVLVEVGADDTRPVDVLAYQLSIACARAGVGAAVEVVVAGAARPHYQQAALRSARPVHGAAEPTAERPAERPVETVSHELLSGSPEPLPPADSGPGSDDAETAVVPEPAPATGSQPVSPATASPAELRPSGGGVALPARSRPAPRGPSPQPDDEAVAAFRAASALPGPPGEPSRTPGRRTPRPITPLRGLATGGSSLRPSPGRSAAVTPFPRPMPSPMPFGRRGLSPVGEPASVRELPSPGPRQPGPDGPALASLVDPLSGPIDDRPADLEARGEPTIDENDPLGLGMLPVSPPETDEPRPEPSPVSDSWLADWITGDWAMSPSALDDPPATDTRPSPWMDGPAVPAPAADVPAASAELAEPSQAETDSRPPESWAPPRIRSASLPEGDPAEPRSGRRRASASRQAFPVPEEGRLETSTPQPPDAETPAAHPPTAEPPAAEPVVAESPLEQSGFILRPESVARLSDADRELLARLQAELDEVPRARITRRAGIGGTNGAGTNGAGANGRRPSPPDMAG